MLVPYIGMGTPEVLEHSNHYKIDDIEVYVGKNVEALSGVLTISIKKILFVKVLSVDGVKSKPF